LPLKATPLVLSYKRVLFLVVAFAVKSELFLTANCQIWS
jgi:hypothetical protein